MGNFIKIDRKILQWEWYKNEHTKNVFFHCLLKAYWKDKKIEGKIIPRGSFVSSIGKIAEELDLTPMEVRTALKHLKLTNEVTSKGTNRNTVFTVTNYDLYQAKEQSDEQTDNEQTTIKEQTINNPLTTNEESKEDNKDEEGKERENERRYTPISPSQGDENTKDEKKKETAEEMFERVLADYNISDYLLEAVRDWIDYKKETFRFTYKEKGLKSLFGQVTSNARKYGDEAVYNAISNSIASGYQGIVFDRLGRNGNSQHSTSLVDEWRNA